jgi:hypothetical protein
MNFFFPLRTLIVESSISPTMANLDDIIHSMSHVITTLMYKHSRISINSDDQKLKSI